MISARRLRRGERSGGGADLDSARTSDTPRVGTDLPRTGIGSCYRDRMTKATLAAALLVCVSCASSVPERPNSSAQSAETQHEESESLLQKAFRENQTPEELRSER